MPKFKKIKRNFLNGSTFYSDLKSPLKDKSKTYPKSYTEKDKKFLKDQNEDIVREEDKKPIKGKNKEGSFKSAFAKARKKQGPGGTFTWKGKKYSTEQKDDTKEIIGENTLEGKKNKKGNTERVMTGDSFTGNLDKSKLVTTPEQEKNIEKSGPKSKFIEQFHPMTVKADSTKSDTTYYSTKKKR